MTTYAQGAVLPHVNAAARELGQRFAPPVIGGWRLDSLAGSYHPLGRALDLMVYRDAAKGAQIAAYAWANRDRLGVIEVIWNQRIITTARAGEGWRPMNDRGSDTQNHKDHVHLSFTATAPKGGGVGGVIDAGGELLDKIGGGAIGAGASALSGLDAVGSFFATIGQRSTWVRVMQVVGGASLIVGGVLIVGRSVVASTAVEAVMTATPAGRVAGVVSTATKGATKAASSAATKAAKAAS